MTIANNIKSIIPKTDKAKEFMKFVEDLSQSDSADRSIAGTLMGTLTTIKFDGSHTMHEHVTEMTNTVAKFEIYGNGKSEHDFGIDEDPVSFSQAMKSHNSDKWFDAMKDELKSIEHNKVWDLVELPKGFTQKDDIDYKETFASVSKKDLFRIVMAMVAHYDLELHQMDVNRFSKWKFR
ncbi:uncharacterized protein LOC109838616 [Asparagus officinalis]|uniref:uncharacterized protein LOC109838616 n=1 Tax=Asparagus officinalis TaxID=4686 RepID=UPI00098E6F68|nr:uncharacterized protein LOC109838616 [Asparagus officinalis]